jgi:hypothetical protein
MPISAEDRLAILELHTQYARRGESVDRPGGPEAWLALFAPDFRFAGPTFETTDADELRGHLTANKTGVGRRTQHLWMNNVEIDGDGDRARTRANVIVMRPDPEGGPARIVLMGDYENVVVKVDGAWRFAEVTLPRTNIVTDLIHPYDE